MNWAKVDIVPGAEILRVGGGMTYTGEEKTSTSRVLVFFFLFFFFLFFGTEGRTQGLALARQALYH